jgi:hypothetical protein
MVALRETEPSIASLLLERGADLTLKNEQDKTAENIAEKEMNHTVLQVLVKARKELERQNKNETTTDSSVKPTMKNPESTKGGREKRVVVIFGSEGKEES